MPLRYYTVPKIGDGITTPFRPKYTDVGALGAGWNVGSWSGMDYGLEGVYLLALNLVAADHTTLAAQADVLAVPTPITDLITAGAATIIKTKLEAVNIPADWVTTALTYQQMLARVLRIVLILQRFHTLFGKLFQGGATLDTTIGALPVNARTALNNAAQQLGADTSSVTGATPIRTALVIVADQLVPSGLSFAGAMF
jgi:hypothetical protein